MKWDFINEALVSWRDEMIDKFEWFLSDRTNIINRICSEYGITEENASFLTKTEQKIDGVNTTLIKLRSNYLLQEDTFLEITESMWYSQDSGNQFTISQTIKDRLVKKPMIKEYKFEPSTENFELLNEAFNLWYEYDIFNLAELFKRPHVQSYIDIFERLIQESYNAGSMKKNLELQLFLIWEKLDNEQVKEIKANIEFLQRYPLDFLRRETIDSNYEIYNVLYKNKV